MRRNSIAMSVALLLYFSAQSARGESDAGLVPMTQKETAAARASSTEQPDNVEAPNEEIQEIVVTAQKREQSANSVGMSISAATGAQLALQGIKDVADLVRIVPGLTVQPSQYNTPVYTLRGIGFYESSLQSPPAVSVYVDEVPLPYPAMTKLAALDLERVEVLKGPQGTLYGQNSTGGAVNYIAAKPTASSQAGVDLSYGNYGAADLMGYVSGPIASDLNGRLAIRSVTSDDWQRSYTRADTLGGTRQLQGRLSFGWRPADLLGVSLAVTGWQDKSDTQAGQLIAITPQVAAALEPAVANYPLAPANARAADWTAGQAYRRDDRFYQLALRADYQTLSAIKLTSVSAYEDYRTRANQDTDGMALRDPDAETSGAISTISQELRLLGEAGPVNWILGANYEHDKIRDRFFLTLPDGSNTSVFPGVKFSYSDNRSATRVDTYGIFGNLDYKLSNGVTLQGGVRFNDDQRRFDGCTYDVDDGISQTLTILGSVLTGLGPSYPAIPRGACVTLDSQFFPAPVSATLRQHNVSWRGGVNWEVTDQALLYANVSKGFKAGTFPTVSASSYRQFQPVTQESVIAYEGGFKTSFMRHRAQLNGAVFYYDYTDKQLRGKIADPVFGTLEALVNIPKSRVQGAELQVAVTPIDGLSFSGSVTYVDTRIQQFVGYSTLGTLADFSGTRFPYTPTWQSVSDVQYDWSIGRKLRAFLGGGLTYQSATNAGIGAPPLLTIDDYSVLGLRAGIRSSADIWRVMVWGKNVANTYYWTNVVRGNDTTFRYAGRPTEFGISFSANFR